MEGIDELLIWHLFIALWIFLKDLDDICTIHGWFDLWYFKVFSEDHKFVDGHDGSFMHDLLEGRVLSSCIAHLTIMFKYYF